MDNMGIVFAVLGVALASLLPGYGSAKAVGITGQAVAGVMTEKPNLFGKLIVLQLLPGTQGIYGFLIAFLGMGQIGILGGNPDISLAKGLVFLGICLPIAIVGYLSALHQAKATVASINLYAKRDDQFGKALLIPIMVEVYAILTLLVSLLAIFNMSSFNV